MARAHTHICSLDKQTAYIFGFVSIISNRSIFIFPSLAITISDVNVKDVKLRSLH
jgi:hypothetical protein